MRKPSSPWLASALDQDYETVFEQHVADNPEAATIIRSLKVERAAALAKCQFSHKFFKIVPIGRPGDADEGVADIVRGLGRQLFEEVAEEMARFADNAAFTKQRVGQKSLRPIKAVVAKMRGLAFLDPAADGAIALVQDTLASLAQHGYIEGRAVRVAATPDRADVRCRPPGQCSEPCGQRRARVRCAVSAAAAAAR